MIDEDELEIITRSLEAFKATLYEEMGIVDRVLNELGSIKFTDSGRPIDSGTGMPITDERRQLIYDCCMKEARKLLE